VITVKAGGIYESLRETGKQQHENGSKPFSQGQPLNLVSGCTVILPENAEGVMGKKRLGMFYQVCIPGMKKNPA
jgi:hypothetical protein